MNKYYKIKEQKLAEMAYTPAILNLPSYDKLLSRSDSKHTLDFIKKEWAYTKENLGYSFREYIELEIKSPKLKPVFDKLSDIEKEDFWRKVDYIGSKL